VPISGRGHCRGPALLYLATLVSTTGTKTKRSARFTAMAVTIVSTNTYEIDLPASIEAQRLRKIELRVAD